MPNFPSVFKTTVNTNLSQSDGAFHVVACCFNLPGKHQITHEWGSRHLKHYHDYEHFLNESRQIDFHRQWQLFNNEGNNSHDPTLLQNVKLRLLFSLFWVNDTYGQPLHTVSFESSLQMQSVIWAACIIVPHNQTRRKEEKIMEMNWTHNNNTHCSSAFLFFFTLSEPEDVEMDRTNTETEREAEWRKRGMLGTRGGLSEKAKQHTVTNE